MSEKVKDIVIRAAKTFGQAFVAQLVLSSADLLKAPSYSVAEKLLLAVAVSAASVVWNTVLVPLWQPVQDSIVDYWWER